MAQMLQGNTITGVYYVAQKGRYPLRKRGKVAVIGGGPAGSFFTLHLLRYAKKAGLALNVTIFEARNFDRAGPAGCARCAGLLSGGLQQNLRHIGLTLPEALIQSRADSYMLHLADGAAEIFPPYAHREIISVYRSQGPRLAPLGRAVNFDNWLLTQAAQAGAEVVYAAATAISAGPQQVNIEAGGNNHTFDFLVLANGVNGRRLALRGLNYHPPQTETMVQDEIAHLPGEHRRVHVYFGRQRGIIFGATVPKGKMVNISLLGNNLNLKSIDRFLNTSGRGYNYQRLCGCKAHVAVSPARGYYSDRFVAVGDAAVTRLYKDGIGAAFRTGQRAAYTAVFHGIGAGHFRRYYAPLCRSMALDNFFGRLLFTFWNLTARIPGLPYIWLRALDNTAHITKTNRYRLALWNMFTGDDSYRNILFSLLDPRVSLFLAVTAGQLWQQQLRQNLLNHRQ